MPAQQFYSLNPPQGPLPLHLLPAARAANIVSVLAPLAGLHF